MGIDKDGSKGGGYVGGFFHLFDWKAKSRKKLFSSKSDIPEHTKQGKKSDGNLPRTRVYLMDEDDNGLWSSSRGNSDYSCASSVTDEEGSGSRGATSVVARLMGLDSMPVPYSSEPYSTPFFDTQSVRDAQFRRQTSLENSQNYQATYSGDLINKIEEPVGDHVELKPQRIPNRPIEKFQTETLPPKSAKTIPITQHKLLSPVKCPGFVPRRNAGHIMEAAAKIIESAPQLNVNSKLPFQGSTSGHLKVEGLREKEKMPQRLPIRVRDLKEKAENTRKTSRLAETSRRIADSDSTAARYLSGQSLSKSYNGGDSTSSLRASLDSESSSGSKSRKSISLAIQAKVNVQKREGLNSSERHVIFQPEQNESKSSKGQSRSQNNSPAPNASGALRQNNQKQNCLMGKEKLPTKASQSRKPLPESIRTKSSSKIAGSTKTGSRKLEMLDGDKEIYQSSMRNFQIKKRSIHGGFQFEKNKAADDLSSDKNKKQVQSSSVVQKKLVEDSRRKEMDVVSFTFTSPLSQKSHGHALDKWGKGVLSETDSMKLSSLGYNVIGGDALSNLLEQKLRELTSEVSSSCQASSRVDSASTEASAFQELGKTPDSISSKLRLNIQKEQDNHTNLLSRNPPSRILKHEFQGIEEMELEEHVTDAKKLLDYRHPSPTSVLEPSLASESCMSSESTDSNWAEGNQQSTTQAATDVDMDISDSASSLSTNVGAMDVEHVLKKATYWELEYVKEILCDLELMYKDFTLGRACSIVTLHLFEQLEDGKGFMETDDDDGDSRLRRKILFDCVTEGMELRFKRYLGGGQKAWEMGLAMARKKEQLAVEVYGEIIGWRRLADSIVDVLVDKDMSCQYGKWVGFEPEVFELGVEIENELLSFLVEEAITGILRL